MEYKQEIERLRQLGLLLPNAKQVSTSSELFKCRCPICGDSIHQDSAHFYVGVKEYNNKQCVVYDCKLCSANGIMSTDILHRMGIHDVIVDEYLKSTISKGFVKTFSQEDDTSGIKYKYPTIKKEDDYKVEYLANRLRMDINNDMLKNYRIVLNFSKFLEMNNIKNPRVNDMLITEIDREGIGFVSTDKTSIQFRNFHQNESIGLRRFNIIHLYQNVKRPFFYSPPMAIDVLSLRPHIAVSESAFNIINIQNYFYGKDNPNVVLGASASKKGFARTIQALINMTGFVSGNLDIYPDNDDTYSTEFFEKLVAPYTTSTFDVTLFKNKETKDFGEALPEGQMYKVEAIKM